MLDYHFCMYWLFNFPFFPLIWVLKWVLHMCMNKFVTCDNMQPQYNFIKKWASSFVKAAIELSSYLCLNWAYVLSLFSPSDQTIICNFVSSHKVIDCNRGWPVPRTAQVPGFTWLCHLCVGISVQEVDSDPGWCLSENGVLLPRLKCRYY